MRLSTMLVVTAAIAATTQAMAQTKIAPTREYTSSPPAEVDKNFGLPSFGTPDAVLPQQRTQAPKTETSKEPDFFQPSSGLTSSNDEKTSDTPDFFAGGPDLTPSKTGEAPSGSGETDTPLFTTNQGLSAGDTPRDGFDTGESDTGGFGSRVTTDGADPGKP